MKYYLIYTGVDIYVTKNKDLAIEFALNNYAGSSPGYYDSVIAEAESDEDVVYSRFRHDSFKPVFATEAETVKGGKTLIKKVDCPSSFFAMRMFCESGDIFEHEYCYTKSKPQLLDERLRLWGIPHYCRVW